MYLKQPVFVVCVLLQLFCSYDLWHTLTVVCFTVSTSRSVRVCVCVCAVPNMAVICGSLSSCLPGMWLKHFLNYFQMVPIAPVVTGIPLCLYSTCSVFLL